MDINEPQTEQPAPSGGRNNLKILLFIGVLVLGGAVVARSVLTSRIAGDSVCSLLGSCSSANSDAAALTCGKTAGCASTQGCAAEAACPSSQGCPKDGACPSAQGCCPDAKACSLEAVQGEPSPCCSSAAPAGCCSGAATE